MQTREEALAYGLSFPDTYQAALFHDDNWQLVRVKGSNKAFLWTYERNGFMHLNLKVDEDWREHSLSVALMNRQSDLRRRTLKYAMAG